MPSRKPRRASSRGSDGGDEGANARLLLPALRGQMGDWVYYVCLISLRDIADRVHMADEIHPSKDLNELIQRELTGNALKITDYLLHQKQRFLNALVLAVYGGEPQWYEIEVRESVQITPSEIPETVEMSIGALALRGDERLFAVDGQHRVKGIQGALLRDSRLAGEQVSAIFVAHRADAAGRTRTRRLFTTLNRYAKPVTTYEKIALDEDDVVAITVRALLDRHPVLVGKVSTARSRNLPASDDRSFTSLPALYDAMDLVLRDVPQRQWTSLKRFRADDVLLQHYYGRAAKFWDLLSHQFKAIQELSVAIDQRDVVRRYRNVQGGHLLFRPVGLSVFARALRALLDDGSELEEAVASLTRAPMDLAAEPWASVLWSSAVGRMMTSGDNVRVAVGLLVYGSGGNLARIRMNADRLLDEWAGVSNRDRGSLVLPQWV